MESGSPEVFDEIRQIYPYEVEIIEGNGKRMFKLIRLWNKKVRSTYSFRSNCGRSSFCAGSPKVECSISVYVEGN